MITKILCTGLFSGKDFCPEKLKIPKRILKKEQILIGDKILHGRYKGEIAKEGSLILESDLKSILNFTSKLGESAKKLDINIYITVYFSGECSFELSIRDIQKLNEFKIPFGITVFESGK